MPAVLREPNDASIAWRYCARSVVAGSTRTARRAGSQAAIIAVVNSTAMTTE